MSKKILSSTKQSKAPAAEATIRKLTQIEKHNAATEAVGYAIGRAMPLLAQFPPTDFIAAGLTVMKLDHLYTELLSTPKEGGTHITQAGIIHGLILGIQDWQFSLPNSGGTQ